MDNIETIFYNYVKDLKPSPLDEYIYVVKNAIFGNIVFIANPTGINMIPCGDKLHDKYYDKMYSINVIKGKTIGYETDIGVLDNFSDIAIYNALQQFRKAMNSLDIVINDIMLADETSYMNSINKDDCFYNNILSKCASDGADKFIINGRPIYISANMLPCSKSTMIDTISYYKTGNDYFTVKFICNKKQNVVYTFMRFLCL